MSSPRVLARIGGALYLVIIVIGLSGEAFVRGNLVVPEDPAATAANLASLEWLWRLGLSAELFMLAFCAVPLALIFYVLLRPVGRELALLALLLNVVSITLQAVAELQLIAALFPLPTAARLSAFPAEQSYAMASLAIAAHSHGFGVSLLFFGGVLLVLGYLVFRSGYFPRALGVLLPLGGLAYLINSFALLLAPDLAGRLFPAVLAPAFIAELAFCVWLLVKGVDEGRWRARASAAGTAAAATMATAGESVPFDDPGYRA